MVRLIRINRWSIVNTLPLSEQLLILVRHSAVTVDPSILAHQWRLSAEGRKRARLLAQQLTPYNPVAVVSSYEMKAQETASIIATTLGIPQQTADGLHEHVRHTFIADPAEWDAAVAAFFARPDELVFGSETARQAQRRFGAAVENLLPQHPEGNLIIVTHGTVLTLFLWQYNPDLDPFSTWKSLALPCFFVFSPANKRVLYDMQGDPPATD
jgi:broad specificity phosphatase PhoE